MAHILPASSALPFAHPASAAAASLHQGHCQTWQKLRVHDIVPNPVLMYLITFSSTLPVQNPLPSKLRYPHQWQDRSEEHTSELQSRGHLVCRLLLEKKKTTKNSTTQRRPLQ